MEQIQLGEGLALSQVAAGCMRIKDSGISQQELLDFTLGCLDMGVTTFDHAPVYGGYTCEGIFGAAVLKKQSELRKKMQIVTKTGIVLPGKNGNQCLHYQATKDEINRELEASLENLGTDYVDLLLVHRPDLLGNPQETAEALDAVVAQGKVRYVGVSNYTPAQIKALESYMKNPIVVNQVALSVNAPENFENGTVDDAFTRGMPLMAWSPLGGGSVFGGKDEQAVRLRAVLQKIAEKYQTAIDVIMYGWLFTHPLPISVITGTMNLERVKAAVEGTKIKLTYDEWYGILEASRGYSVP